MSIFDQLFGSLGSDDRSDFTPPTTLCPGDCPLGPGACSQCRPYKEKLKEALYNVDHLEAFLARYEVTGGQTAGATTCPHCGAPSGNPFRCEYCGMQIREDDGKIRVASANDIPDPILEAQNIIFERHNAIVGRAEESDSSGDLLSSLFELFGGAVETSEGLGTRMTKEEISEAAQSYGVSISTYLNGLDNGKYLTLEAKKRGSATYGYAGSGLSGAGMAGAGMAGLGLGSLASSLFGGSSADAARGASSPLDALLGGSGVNPTRGATSPLDALLGGSGNDPRRTQGGGRRPEPPRPQDPWGMRNAQPNDMRGRPEQPRQSVQQPAQNRRQEPQPQPAQKRSETPLRQPTQSNRAEAPLRQPTQNNRAEAPLRQPAQNRGVSPLRQSAQPNHVSVDPHADKRDRHETPKAGPSRSDRKAASDRGNDKRGDKGKR